MTKELQDLAWCSLPKEFKEEVKKYYQHVCKYNNLYSARGATEALELLFGKHNLTSDAEEEEMLTVSRKEVQDVYKYSKEIISNEAYGSKRYAIHIQTLCVLERIFGSKCLPDDGDELSPEPQPAEPKFKVGDKVRICSRNAECYGQVGSIRHIYANGNVAVYFNEHDNNRYYAPRYLEPYAELTENLKPSNSGELESQKTCTQTFTDDTSTFTDNRQSQCKSQSRNLSQETANCDKQFGTILKDGFHNERRLNIAAMMMQGLLANPNNNANLSETVADALNCADALLHESEKGGSK